MAGFSALPGSSSSSSGATWTGVARVKGPRWARMPLLTIGMLGLQIVWSVEMGYASPYLLQLGLSKSLMSIVFVAGPLSGLIVQPLIGVLADHSKSRFGRRRPYMLGGSLICVGAIILLGFTRWFSSIFVSEGTGANDILTIAFAVWSIYCIDFSINAVQAADRAILVDLLPPSEQELGNAWAGRMFGLGSVAGFFVGNVDLPKTLPFLGKTQLQVLSVVTSIFLMATQGLTAASVSEKVLVKDAQSDGRNGFVDIFKDIWKNILTLPRVIMQICCIQFFFVDSSWIAWFPVLFFSTVWVGEIYTKQALEANPSLEITDDIQADATRAGSRALLWSSILSLGASVVLPFVVQQSSFSESNEKDWGTIRGKQKGSWAVVLVWLKSMKMHLATLWMVSHLLFAITMGLTFALITLTGFSWAVTQWVPFSLLGEAILVGPSPKYDEASIPLTDHRAGGNHSRHGSAAERQQLMFSADEEFRDATEPPPHHSERPRTSTTRSSSGSGDFTSRVRSPFGLNPVAGVSGVDIHLTANATSPPISRKSSNTSSPSTEGSFSAIERGKTVEDGDGESESEDGDAFLAPSNADSGISNKAGIILGIHNIFVVIPQFLVTGLSSILFALLEPHKSVLDQGHAGHPAAGNVPSKNSTGRIRRFYWNYIQVWEPRKLAASVLLLRAFCVGDYPENCSPNSVTPYTIPPTLHSSHAMVNTRKKKVDYSKLDESTSEGEQDGRASAHFSGWFPLQSGLTPRALVKEPPPKRQRVKKHFEDDTFVDTGPSDEPKAEKGKGKATTTRGKKRKSGRLEGLMRMPVDVFAEVCGYLKPIDLLHLARSSKRLREILMSKESKPLWCRSRSLLNALPDCPEDLSEPAYASLMFENGCQMCGNSGTRKTLYTLRVRYCKSCCLAALCGPEDAILQWPQIAPNILDLLPSVQVDSPIPGRRYRWDSSLYLKRMVQDFIGGIESKETEEDVEKFIEEVLAVGSMMTATGGAMQLWKDAEANARHQDSVEATSSRQRSIEAKLIDLGWTTKDFPRYNEEWRSLTRQPRELTDKIWKRIYPKLVPLLENRKKERLEEEKMMRVTSRRLAIKHHFYRLVDGLVENDSTLRPSMFDLDIALFKIPGVAELVENDTADVTTEMWSGVVEDVKAAALAYNQDTRRRLLSLIPLSSSASSEEKAEEGADITPTEPVSGGIDPMPKTEESESSPSGSNLSEEKLFLATSAFRPKGCKELVWYPDLLDHWCRPHQDGDFAGRFFYAIDARSLIQRLLMDLGLEPSSMYAQAKDLQANCLCARCDERIVEPMTFCRLVSHFEKEHEWIRSAREATMHDPDLAYPGKSPEDIPEICDTHDLADEKPLARLLNTETRLAHREVRDGFFTWNQELGLALDGSMVDLVSLDDMDSDDMDEYEFLMHNRDEMRLCKLCPRSIARIALSPGEMHIHISTRHRKEPDLAVDSEPQCNSIFTMGGFSSIFDAYFENDFCTSQVHSVTMSSAPETSITYTRLGKSGLRISKIILGCMSYGSPEWQPWVLDEAEGMKQIKVAYDLGINTFDTANVYSNGLSEVILGKAIKEYKLPRDEIVVMTKVFSTVGRTQSEALFGKTPDELNSLRYTNQYGLSRKHIFESVQHSLKRLQLDYVDVLQCHRFDYNTPIEETMQALHDVVKAGYARYIGMSACWAWQFQKMQNYAKTHGLTEFISMQNFYNAIYREEEREMIPLLQDLGVGMIPFSPLARGFLTRELNEESDRAKNDSFFAGVGNPEKEQFLGEINRSVSKIAKDRGVTMAQVALAWQLSKPFVSAPIVGTTSVEKLKDLIAGINLKLTEEEIKAIDGPYQPRSVLGHA
ncbi:hypothetical protein FRB99_007831 [Tulasnella sp. 403]|nr:hypothetical protein FRB99_007831 [Tulasnella sp. 403]